MDISHRLGVFLKMVLEVLVSAVIVLVASTGKWGTFSCGLLLIASTLAVGMDAARMLLSGILIYGMSHDSGIAGISSLMGSKESMELVGDVKDELWQDVPLAVSLLYLSIKMGWNGWQAVVIGIAASMDIAGNTLVQMLAGREKKG